MQFKQVDDVQKKLFYQLDFSKKMSLQFKGQKFDEKKSNLDFFAESKYERSQFGTSLDFKAD